MNTSGKIPASLQSSWLDRDLWLAAEKTATSRGNYTAFVRHVWACCGSSTGDGPALGALTPGMASKLFGVLNFLEQSMAASDAAEDYPGAGTGKFLHVWKDELEP